MGRVCYNIIVKPARNACAAVTEFEAATIAFQNATIAHQEATLALQKLTVEFQKDSLALRETSNLIGFIQCGLIAAGLFLVYYFNRTRDRAQTRVDTDAQRKHEADARGQPNSIGKRSSRQLNSIAKRLNGQPGSIAKRANAATKSQ